MITSASSPLTSEQQRLSRYKTAKARIACAHFRAGDFVSVEYSNISNGVHFFLIRETQHGKLPYPVAYPMHHLTDFVF